MTDVVTGSTVPRRQLGRFLRRLREEAQMTVKAASEAMEWSVQKLWRIEKGETPLRSLDVEAMCRLYDAPAKQTEALMALAKETKAKGWWHSYSDVIPAYFDLYIGLEEAAESFRAYESELVPGIFQTERYASAIMRAGGTPEKDLPRKVRARLDRQRILTRRKPPRYEAVLNEAVLRRPVGGSEVMAEQLRGLAALSEAETISLQVVPFGVEVHLGMLTGSFVVLEFPRTRNGPGEPTTIYAESWTGALYLDKPQEVQQYQAAWQDLTQHALDEDASRELIRAAAKELTK